MLNEETTYTQLRENLASKLAEVADNNTIVVVKRRDGKDVALIAADELSSLLETVHLLRSPDDCSSLVWCPRAIAKPHHSTKHHWWIVRGFRDWSPEKNALSLNQMTISQSGVQLFSSLNLERIGCGSARPISRGMRLNLGFVMQHVISRHLAPSQMVAAYSNPVSLRS